MFREDHYFEPKVASRTPSGGTWGGALYGLGGILEDFGVPMAPPFSHFFGKKGGSGEEPQKRQILVGIVAGLRRPQTSLQDMSLGLVWKCTALTRQAAGFRPGAAYPIALARKPATVPTKNRFFSDFYPDAPFSPTS